MYSDVRSEDLRVKGERLDTELLKIAELLMAMLY